VTIAAHGRAKVGLTALALAVLLSGTGCGSRASDAEIAAAVTGSGQVGSAGVALPAEAPLNATAAAPEAAPPVTQTRPAAGANSTATTSTSSGTTGAATPGKGGTNGVSSGSKPAQPAASLGPATKSEVRIGQVGAFSGVLGAVTAYAPKTLGAWVAYTNAHGGLNGHPVKLIVGDDQADPATALTLVKRMVESDGVQAFVGNVNIFGFPQIEKYTREKNIPLIGGDSVDPLWATSPNSFPVQAPAIDGLIRGLKTLIDRGGTKIGLLYCLEVAQLCSYANDRIRQSPEVGSKVVQSYQVSIVAPSYTSQCLRMKQAGIDVVWLGLDGAGAARAAQDCANQGFKPKLMLFAIDATKETPSMPALGNALIPGGTFPPNGVEVPAIARYRQIMSQYAPTLGDGGFSSIAWAAGEMLGLAGRNLSENPTSVEFYQALWQVKNETLGGLTVPLTFTKGRAPQAKNCVFLWGITDQKWSAPYGVKPIC
jgi:branched-chain amino acid transport system substrate-binding protein